MSFREQTKEVKTMTLGDRILDPSAPVRLFELVPPASAKARAIERTIADVSNAQHLADAINLPEIHDESRGGAPRTAKFVPRVEPRVLGGRPAQADRSYRESVRGL
jgi:hypothetical protein